MMLWMLVLPHLALAETLEEVINPRMARNEWVSDMANVLSIETKRRLNEVIDQLAQKTTAEIAVVTIKRTEGSVPKEFATELFTHWGVGKKGKDNGVLVLLVMDARRIEVETGYGVEGILPDGKVGEILDKYVIPRFKSGDFGGGLVAGVEAIAGVISKAEKPSLGPAAKTPGISASSRSVGTLASTPLAAILLIVVLCTLPVCFLVGYFLWRSGIRHCSGCSRRMRRLKEDQDDAYLSQVQRHEEWLGSVDYKVWRCDDCQIITLSQKLRMFTSYKMCPGCGHRTVIPITLTIKEATHERDGVGEVVRRCTSPECSYEESIGTQKIPRLPIGSSSDWGGGSSGGGGSFGGGSSGGGGAGRSW